MRTRLKWNLRWPVVCIGLIIQKIQCAAAEAEAFFYEGFFGVKRSAGALSSMDLVMPEVDSVHDGGFVERQGLS